MENKKNFDSFWQLQLYGTNSYYFVRISFFSFCWFNKMNHQPVLFHLFISEHQIQPTTLNYVETTSPLKAFYSLMKLVSSSKHRLVPLDPNHNWLLKDVFPLMSNAVLDILFLSLTKGNFPRLFKVVLIIFYFFFLNSPHPEGLIN